MVLSFSFQIIAFWRLSSYLRLETRTYKANLLNIIGDVVDWDKN